MQITHTGPLVTPVTPNALAAENQRLRGQLADMVEQAHRNQEIMLRHQMCDLKFIGAGGFRELIENIFGSLKEISGLDVVTLLLIDADHEIRRILAGLDIDVGEFPQLRFMQNADELGKLQRCLQKPVLGCYDEKRFGAMFSEPLKAPASVAIMPLIRNGKLRGTLNFGSARKNRFTSEMATDFIEHRAAIIAICLDNVINRERLKHIGLTDPLTSVHNRRYLEQRLLEEIGRTRRHGNRLSCLYIDIDHFKQINDRIGHQAGDEVLCEVAARIKAELRVSDALGRFGGEEFVALLTDTDSKDALVVAERIRVGIAEQPLRLSNGYGLHVTVSIGVAELEPADCDERVETIAQQLLAQADRALYQAKEGGRNKVVDAFSSRLSHAI